MGAPSFVDFLNNRAIACLGNVLLRSLPVSIALVCNPSLSQVIHPYEPGLFSRTSSYQGVPGNDLKKAGLDIITTRREPSVDLVLHVAPPVGGPTSVVGSSLSDILQEVRAFRSSDTHIDWVQPGSPNADINLIIDDGQFWFAAGNSYYVKEGNSKTASVHISNDPTKTAREVSETLSRIARVSNLVRLAEAFRIGADGLRLDLSLEHNGAFHPQAMSAGQQLTVMDATNSKSESKILEPTPMT